MIHDAAYLRTPATLRADLCVIGSGAGGSMVAMIAAEAGLSVVVLEAGEHVATGQMSQREEEMIPRLLWEAGGRTTRDRALRLHQGKGVGGSTLHNFNLIERAPAYLIERWHREQPLEHLPPARWSELYDEVEALLGVETIPVERRNRANRLLQAGTEALGWRGGPLRHNRAGCIGSGYCLLGCAYDAKRNAARVALPRIVRAGAHLITRCQAIRVTTEGARTTGVQAVALQEQGHRAREDGAIWIEAARVCVSASATATAALLLRSGLPGPKGSTGETLRVHPSVAVAGEFDEPVRAWQGIPQSYQCTEWLDLSPEERHRAWIVTAFAHPMGFATTLPGHGAEHRRWMERYEHLVVLAAMVHDHGRGHVRPDGELGISIDSWPDQGDRRELHHGLVRAAELLFAAGARRVIAPAHPSRVLERRADLGSLDSLPIRRGAIDVAAVHPMASVPMGDDTTVSAVSSQGRHHQVEGLWVADGSLLPSSIGVPPQLSIYALGLHVGRALAR